MDVFASGRTSADSRTIVSIRIADVHRLVKKEKIGVCVPAIRIVRCVMPFIGDTTRSEFE